MKITKKVINRAAIASIVIGSLALYVPVRANAQFLGGIVHDPINWTQLSGIWGQDISTFAKIVETLKISTQIYQHAMYMEQQIAAISRQGLVTTIEQASNVAIHSKYNETIAYPPMYGGRPDLASTVWQNSTIALASKVSGADDSQAKMGSNSSARLASIEMSDGLATACMGQAAAYRQGYVANAGAVGQLWTMVMDDAKGINSEIQQLNLHNAAAAQAVNEQRAQGLLHTCQVQQQALQIKMERDKLAEAENFDTNIQNEQSSGSPTAWGKSAQTITNW